MPELYRKTMSCKRDCRTINPTNDPEDLTTGEEPPRAECVTDTRKTKSLTKSARWKTVKVKRPIEPQTPSMPTDNKASASKTNPEESFTYIDSPSQHTSRQARIDDGPEGDDANYEEVKVLLLTFAFTDIPELEEETSGMERAFDDLGYEVESFLIDMQRSLERVQAKIRDFMSEYTSRTLFIIYYHGHGGRGNNHSLILASHAGPADTRKKRTPKVAVINWRDIEGEIMSVPCDTLIILDCCEAGLAAINLARLELEDASDFRKEMIGACGWDTSTLNHMSPSLWQSLDDSVHEDFGSISTSSLVRRMNIRILRSTDWDEDPDNKPPQAVHYVLQRNVGGKMILPLDL
ncbi:hypothetical protein ABW21_db0205676 [Orbilia brochopaga]|nr:hypothetical protein ABW21_db0205676 [Drechslerella brochopaga]